MNIICGDCGTDYPTDATFRCRKCDGLLEVAYESPLDRKRIESGGTLFEKYGNRLPSAGSVAGIEGGTPLIRVDELPRKLGVEATVYLKDERRNPTNSFKDRALAPTVSLAAERGETALVTASSGNAAAACAHYAARAGIDCYLLVETKTPAGKLTEPQAYGARAIRVPELFEAGEAELAGLLSAVADHLDAYLTFAYRPFNPVVLEGVKTISYEVAEQLDWKAPDWVISASGGGDNLAAQYRGFHELASAGLIDETPRMVAAQAAGAAPLAEAVAVESERPKVIDRPDTLASGISAPFAGQHALDAIRKSGGTAVGVTDEALLDGERLMAQTTAVWPEPSSATVVPALRALANSGDVTSDDTVVLTVTGSGHKHTEPFEKGLSDVPTAERDPDVIAKMLLNDL